jgi:hypothetical protein
VDCSFLCFSNPLEFPKLTIKSGTKLKIRILLLLSSLLAVILITTYFSYYFPYYFDDAFISFRITRNFLESGFPYFEKSVQGYTSTSIIYPFWNGIFALILGKSWNEFIPIVNGILLSMAFIITIWKSINKLQNADVKLLLLVFIGALPLYLDFRNIHYGNSGLETCFYMLCLSLSIFPNHNQKSKWWGWLLIFIRPEGFLAGIGNLANLIYQKKIRPKEILMQISFGLIVLLTWACIGKLIFGQIIPQSIVAKSNHLISRKIEIEKGLGYLLFSGKYVYLLITIVAVFLDKKTIKCLFPAISWLFLYNGLFSLAGAWWPWYVSPMFVAYWYMTSKSLQVIYEQLQKRQVGYFDASYWLVISFFLVWSVSIFDFTKTKIENASEAFILRAEKSEMLAKHLETIGSATSQILLEPIGLLGWYCKECRFLDYPGLSNQAMASFLSTIETKIPHRLTDASTNSLILSKFNPEIILVWKDEKEAFEVGKQFQKKYQLQQSFKFFPNDARMDSVYIFKAKSNKISH